MATIQDFTFSQSSSGQILTFTDTSVYDDPISNYTRQIKLYSNINATGTLIATLSFVGTALTVDYDITSDRYFSAQMIWTGSPAIASKIHNFVTTRYEYNALVNKQKINCGCQKKVCNPTFDGFIDLYLAQKATDYGNAGLANDFISASFTLLTK